MRMFGLDSRHQELKEALCVGRRRQLCDGLWDTAARLLPPGGGNDCILDVRQHVPLRRRARLAMSGRPLLGG